MGRSTTPVVEQSTPIVTHGLAIAAATAAATAGLYMAEEPVMMVAAAAAGVGGTALAVTSGLTKNRRLKAMNNLRAALTPVIGTASDGAWVLARKWGRGRDQVFPSRLVIRYSALMPDDSVDWKRKVLEIVERRLPVKATLANHEPMKLRMELVLLPPLDLESLSPVVQRAQKVVNRLFGERADVEFELDETGDLRRVVVDHDLFEKVAIKQARMRLERVYSAMLPGRWRAKWDLEKDRVVFELRPTLPSKIPHVAEELTEKNLYQIPIAVDEDGNVVLWNLGGSGPHCLVVGRTGTGKTVCINGVVMEFARRGWPCWISDPKQIEFIGMRDWPNVQIVATSVVEQITMIRAAHDLMEERYTRIAEGAEESEFEPLLIVLDEYRNFHRAATAWYGAIKVRGMAPKCPVFDWVAAIAEKGRSAKIHLLNGTQRPDAEFMSGGMRDNYDTRVSMGPLSPQGAQMMWDSVYLGVAVPRKIRGRGTAINEEEQVSEIQVPWTPDPRRADNPEDRAILDALRPEAISHHPLELDLGPETDIDGGEIGPWARVLEARWIASTGRTGAGYVRAGEATTLLAAVGEESVAGTAPWEYAGDVEDAATDPDEIDIFEGYDEETPVRASKVSPGDLVLVDDILQLWGVVEAVEEDLIEDGQLVIDWRSNDDDGGGSLSLAPTETVLTRTLTSDTEED